MNEEEILQTTTCSTKDLQEDMEGWKKAFTKELDSFERLNVKTDVWENALDLRNVEILPGKVVMVKKPIGDGTHLKKGRVVVCGNFLQVQPEKKRVQILHHFRCCERRATSGPLVQVS